MSEKNKLKTAKKVTSFKLDPELYRRLKVCCAAMDKTITETLEVIIRDAVEEFERAAQ